MKGWCLIAASCLIPSKCGSESWDFGGMCMWKGSICCPKSPLLGERCVRGFCGERGGTHVGAKDEQSALCSVSVHSSSPRTQTVLGYKNDAQQALIADHIGTPMMRFKQTIISRETVGVYLSATSLVSACVLFTQRRPNASSLASYFAAESEHRPSHS